MLLIKEAVDRGNQVIIATHSPILIHYPDALILKMDEQGMHEINLTDIDYLNDLRSFLNQPERFLKHLFK